MRVVKTIKPNSPGARRFRQEWGDRLIAVRYREDGFNQKHYTTIEIVVDERNMPQQGSDQKSELARKKRSIVAIQVSYHEVEVRQKIKERGAIWSNQLKLWLIKYETAAVLALTARIVSGAAETCTDVDISL